MVVYAQSQEVLPQSIVEIDFKRKEGHMRLNILYGLTLFVFLTTSCTITYRAGIYPIPPDLKVKEFQGQGEAISIEGKAKKGKTHIGDTNVYTYYADLKQVTDVTVSFLTEELSKRGFLVQRDVPKSITLNVTKMKITYSFGSYHCFMNIEYTTSGGHRRIFSQYDSSGVYDRACTGAITKGVVDLLNDKRLIDFLQSKDK